MLPEKYEFRWKTNNKFLLFKKISLKFAFTEALLGWAHDFFFLYLR